MNEVVRLNTKPRVENFTASPSAIPPALNQLINDCFWFNVPRKNNTGIPDLWRIGVRHMGRKVDTPQELIEFLQVDLAQSEVSDEAFTVEELKARNVRAVLWIPDGKYYSGLQHSSHSLELHDFASLATTGVETVCPEGILYQKQSEPLLHTMHDESCKPINFILLKGPNLEDETLINAKRVKDSLG